MRVQIIKKGYSNKLSTVIFFQSFSFFSHDEKPLFPRGFCHARNILFLSMMTEVSFLIDNPAYPYYQKIYDKKHSSAKGRGFLVFLSCQKATLFQHDCRIRQKSFLLCSSYLCHPGPYPSYDFGLVERAGERRHPLAFLENIECGEARVRSLYLSSLPCRALLIAV